MVLSKMKEPQWAYTGGGLEREVNVLKDNRLTIWHASFPRSLSLPNHVGALSLRSPQACLMRRFPGREKGKETAMYEDINSPDQLHIDASW